MHCAQMRFLEDDSLVLTLEISLLLVMGSEQCARNENECTGLRCSEKFGTGNIEAWSELYPGPTFLIGTC